MIPSFILSLTVAASTNVSDGEACNPQKKCGKGLTCVATIEGSDAKTYRIEKAENGKCMKIAPKYNGQCSATGPTLTTAARPSAETTTTIAPEITVSGEDSEVSV